MVHRLDRETSGVMIFGKTAGAALELRRLWEGGFVAKEYLAIVHGRVEATEGGPEHLRAVVMDDSLGLCAELDAAMVRHVATYSDEWADTLADPERLARFTSFVNAPEVPDPSIAFVTERGQIRPARADEKPLVAGPVLEVVRS